MPFSLIRGDITKLPVDAIVNAANQGLRGGSGVCGAIFQGAGYAEMQAACDALAPIKTGEAVITPGFKLPARHVIHAVGPVYDRRRPGECEDLLTAAYLSSLELALENGLHSIAFPLISGGIYGYPREEALQVAHRAIAAFLSEEELDVSLVLFDEETYALAEALLEEAD